jgi:hypothetical protein
VTGTWRMLPVLYVVIAVIVVGALWLAISGRRGRR